MPAASDEVSEAELWDLVYFVLTEAGLHTPVAAGRPEDQGDG